MHPNPGTLENGPIEPRLIQSTPAKNDVKTGQYLGSNMGSGAEVLLSNAVPRRLHPTCGTAHRPG